MTQTTDLILAANEHGQQFYVTPQQFEVLNTLSELHKGGIGTVYGYRPKTNYTVIPTVDMQIITRFSTKSLYARKIAALDAITFDDVLPIANANPILRAQGRSTLVALFEGRKAMLKQSMQHTIVGNDRSDAHRQGHDRCYARVADSVKVNFKTEKVQEGKVWREQPTLLNGFPIANTIMLSYLELNRTYRVPGERKHVKHGSAVLMGNCISSLLNKRSVGFRTLSLTPESFESIKISNRKITADQLLNDDGVDPQLILEAIGI